MLQAMAIPEYRTVGVSIIWCHPRGKSKNGVFEATEGIERMGNKRRMVIAPNKPSNPTATRGATV